MLADGQAEDGCFGREGEAVNGNIMRCFDLLDKREFLELVRNQDFLSCWCWKFVREGFNGWGDCTNRRKGRS